MKKQIILALVLAAACPQLDARGGDAVAGLAGGLAVGTVIGSATARGSGRSARAEQEAVRAQDKAEQVRQEQERMRSSQTNMIFMFLIALLTLAVIGLAVLVLRKK